MVQIAKECREYNDAPFGEGFGELYTVEDYNREIREMKAGLA